MRIAKKRVKPLQISKLEALLRRLPDTHPKTAVIKQDLLKRQIGYRGEKSLDYYFDNLSLEKDVTLLHDLRLKGVNGHFFQIDTLILSQSSIILIEVKNIAGSLYVNPLTHQMIRTTRSSEDVFLSPLLQTQIQKNQLKEWLVSHNWPLFHIVDLVVISDPSTKIVVDSANQHLMSRVIHAARLPEVITNIVSKSSDHLISNQKMDELVSLLLKNHTERDINILIKYEIESGELAQGVSCPLCFQLSMVRKSKGRAWICGACKYTSQNAHSKPSGLLSTDKTYYYKSCFTCFPKNRLSAASALHFVNVMSPLFRNLQKSNLHYPLPTHSLPTTKNRKSSTLTAYHLRYVYQKKKAPANASPAMAPNANGTTFEP
ncbi:nuclease-related domain-containing protein [Alkalicoccobacillus murimartini]|uniref:NERD domain-containing protein n=1 Tax=Alkalicoccobacillus murimartini TaxID=171685 RepID=A0ABT9YCF2_9BACI|nr:nuclease-related domain-containing protein [Alkalicoccobacillus murimartini]MDQ0205404.1 hypothetical protein [Alkalicoccobacillus murimartini]